MKLLQCCFPSKKNNKNYKATIKNLDTEISNVIKNTPLVTGQPIENNLNKSKILVRITEFGHLRCLANEGWKTNGKIEISDNISYLWYEKDEQETKQQKDIPSHPDKDTKAEFDWSRIVDSELEKYQANGWLARDLCPKTNRIWVCCQKKNS
tara:strand:- start:412 stop:867 length:456 start_codon:yes stop_codon:yes gene_type:complete